MNWLGYDFSSPSIASSGTIVFVPPANNVVSNNVETENNEVKNELTSENINKGKSIVGAPPKVTKNETKNPRAKKTNSQKPKQKKQHLCHHCGVFRFEKMDDQDDIHTTYEKLYKLSKNHEKLYKLVTKKLIDVELDREELSTKFDEANQTIGALRFEYNFLAEMTRKLETELFQVRAQPGRTSSMKLNEMLSLKKSASD